MLSQWAWVDLKAPCIATWFTPERTNLNSVPFSLGIFKDAFERDGPSIACESLFFPIGNRSEHSWLTMGTFDELGCAILPVGANNVLQISPCGSRFDTFPASSPPNLLPCTIAVQNCPTPWLSKIK